MDSLLELNLIHHETSRMRLVISHLLTFFYFAIPNHEFQSSSWLKNHGYVMSDSTSPQASPPKLRRKSLRIWWAACRTTLCLAYEMSTISVSPRCMSRRSLHLIYTGVLFYANAEISKASLWRTWTRVFVGKVKGLPVWCVFLSWNFPLCTLT